MKDKISYHLIRSRRKTVGLMFNDQAELVVRAPLRTSLKDIERILQKHERWIDEKRKLVKSRLECTKELTPLSADELNTLAEEARRVIPERVKHYAPIVGVTYGRITIRKQKTLWGSCSANGNLNFNVMLMKVPPELLDYVVVHELCHRLEMNHSPGFWAEVTRVLPDGKLREKKMKEYSYLLRG